MPFRRRILAGFGALLLVAACDVDLSAAPPDASEPLPQTCTPGEEVACYDGPEGTENVGPCQAGQRVCNELGLGFGPCEGQVLPDPEDCTTKRDDNCDGLTTCGETVSSWRYGAARDETVVRLAMGNDGARYLMGHYRNDFELAGEPLPADNGTRDVYVMKVDADDNILWTRAFHSTSHTSPRGLAFDGTDRVGVAIGAFGTVNSPDLDPSIETAGGGDVLVASLDDADGSILWTDLLGDDELQRPEGAAFTPEGDLVVAGGASGSFDLGGQIVGITNADADAFFAIYDRAGNIRDGRHFDGLDEQRARGVCVAPDGAIGIVGEAFGEVDFGDGLLEAQGERDAFVAVFEPDGTLRYSRMFGGTAFDRAYDCAFDHEGLVMVGRFVGDMRIGPELHEGGTGSAFIIALSPTGHPRWSTAVSGADGGAYDVAIDSLGRSVVSGYQVGGLTFGQSVLPSGGVREPQIMVLKLEPDGRPVWARGVTVEGNQSVSDAFRAFRILALGPDDRIHVAGFVEGPIDFGDDTEHEDFGNADAFLWVLDP